MQPGDFVKLGDNHGSIEYAHCHDAIGNKGETEKVLRSHIGIILDENDLFFTVLWNGKIIEYELKNTLIRLF